SVRGHDALSAALLGLPGAIAVFAVSMIGSRVGRRLGTGRAFVVALTVAAVGNLLLLGVGVDGGGGVYIAASLLVRIRAGPGLPARVGAGGGLGAAGTRGIRGRYLRDQFRTGQRAGAGTAGIDCRAGVPLGWRLRADARGDPRPRRLGHRSGPGRERGVRLRY